MHVIFTISTYLLCFIIGTTVYAYEWTSEILKTSNIARYVADILMLLEMCSTNNFDWRYTWYWKMDSYETNNNMWAKGEVLVQYELLLLVCPRDPRIHKYYLLLKSYFNVFMNTGQMPPPWQLVLNLFVKIMENFLFCYWMVMMNYLR